MLRHGTRRMIEVRTNHVRANQKHVRRLFAIRMLKWPSTRSLLRKFEGGVLLVGLETFAGKQTVSEKGACGEREEISPVHT